MCTVMGCAFSSLDVSGNQLTGGLPAGVVGLGQLSQLVVSSNGFKGSIPTTIGAMTALRYVSESRAVRLRGLLFDV